MDWKMAGLAIAIAMGIWLFINRPAPAAPMVEPEYGIHRQDGSVDVIHLMCDEMLEMRERTIEEGKLRLDDAISCGSSRMGKCLPYYIQDSVLYDLYTFLNIAIADNCKEN
jgi:hypothetical protein